MVVLAHDVLCDLRGQECAVQVDVDDLLPGLVGDVDVVARQADARIVVRNVHSAKLADEILLQLVDLRLVGHVAVQRNDLHAVALGHLLGTAARGVPSRRECPPARRPHPLPPKLPRRSGQCLRRRP